MSKTKAKKFWNKARSKRVASAVRAFNASITRAEKRLASEGRGDLINLLPSRRTVADVKAEVGENLNVYRRIVGYKNDAKRGRPSELDRLKRSVNPYALEFVMVDGEPTMTFFEQWKSKSAATRMKRQANRVKAKVEELKGSALGGVTWQDEHAILENGGVLDGVAWGEPDDSTVDVSKATVEKWHAEDNVRKAQETSVTAFADNYLREWMNPVNMHDAMVGFNQLIDDFEWLTSNAPDDFMAMFAMGYPELDIPWIVISSTLYDYAPFEGRHYRAVEFVHDVRVRLSSERSGE